VERGRRTNLNFFQGQPSSVALFDPAGRTESRLRNVTAFVQTHSLVGGALTVDAGLQLRSARGWLTSSGEGPSPGRRSRHALSLALPVSRKTVLRAGLSRYTHRLLAQYLDFGNPDAPSSRTYLWNDLNGDRQFQRGRAGCPAEGLGGNYSRIDPGLKRPIRTK